MGRVERACSSGATPGPSLPSTAVPTLVSPALHEALAARLQPWPAEARDAELIALRESALQHLGGANFGHLGPAHLRALFEDYDARFFERDLSAALPGPIDFLVSRRMTRSAGRTRFYADGRADITLSLELLGTSFGPGKREVRVNGLPAPDRLAALLRVMEHELAHLLEFLLWGKSSCRRARFARITADLFGHTEPCHELITRAELAREAGLRPGQRVRFEFEGARFEGLLNRVTKRATVLVPDPGGVRYSDGGHYRKFYVPLSGITPV